MSPKLSEEFRGRYERLSLKSSDWSGGEAGAYRVAAQEVEQLEITNEALTTRVAELELEVAVLKDNLGMARKVIDNLKAQLAWAPVAQGLPTEPGAYVMFSDGHPEMLDTWVLREGYWLFGKFAYSSPWREYTRFRPITIPEAT